MADAGVVAAECWFCRRGRHSECMGEVPVTGRPRGGPHDCSFGSEMARCACACA